MDEYRIDTHELWYYILYPICFIILVFVAWGIEASIVAAIEYVAPSIDINNNLMIHGIGTGIVVGIILTIILIIELRLNPTAIPWNKFDAVVFLQIIGAIALATVLYIAIVNLNTYLYPPRQSFGSIEESLAKDNEITKNLKIQLEDDKIKLDIKIATVKAYTIDEDIKKLSDERRNINNPDYTDQQLALKFKNIMNDALKAARIANTDPTITNEVALTKIYRDILKPSGTEVKVMYDKIYNYYIALDALTVAQVIYDLKSKNLKDMTAKLENDKTLGLLATQRSKLYEPVKEAFVDGSNINQILKKVQTATQALQKSLDTLSTATDDTCFVMRGIERRFIDNATAPEGEGVTPSPAEAKEMKAQKLPGAKKQWNQKKQDWSDTHGQVSMIECFSDGSLSELVAANQQLSDLLASAPVQRVVAQVKSLQTSAMFSQSYIDQLVAKLTGESFENPEDTITTSNKLIARASEVQASINKILDSTNTLKKNYATIDAKSNDPNTVNNLAANKV